MKYWRYKNTLQIILLSCFLFLLTGCKDEYISFHSKELQIANKPEIKTKSGYFLIENIKEKKYELVSTPNPNWLEKILNLITWAKKRLYVEVYILSEKRIIDAIIEAKKRWVDTKVILEQWVYWAWNTNKKVFDKLKSNAVEVVYANKKNYNFTHAKYIIVDDNYIISSGNFSHSTFVSNVDHLLIWNIKSELETLLDVFDNDMKWIYKEYCQQDLIISPKCPRIALEQIISWAKSSIDIFSEAIWDEKLENLLIKKSKENVKVRLVVGDFNKIKSNMKLLNLFKSYPISIIAPKKPYIHTKVIIIDSKILYVWSINLTTNSMENNREIWTIFKNNEIVRVLENEFLTLFSKQQ